ncbi:hypothetical protein BH24ACT12_BH24ACT12_04370 [soil metagenome]
MQGERTRRPVQRMARDVARARTAAARERRRVQAREAQLQRAAAVRARMARSSPGVDSVESAAQPAQDTSSAPSEAPLLWAGAFDQDEQPDHGRRRWAMVSLSILAILAVGLGTWTALRSTEPASPTATTNGENREDVMSTDGPSRRTLVRADVRASGAVRTEVRLAAGDEPIRQLVLTLPDLPAGTGEFAPVVSGVRIRADGLVLPGAPDLLSVNQTRRVDLAEGARTVQLRYRTAGAVDRTAGSGSTRALVLLNALQVRAVTGEPGSSEPAEEVVAMASEGVLALACVATEGIPLRPCGALDGDSWVVAAPSGEPPTVVAQVDLERV